MTTWWTSLTTRERILIMIAAALIFGLGGYQFVARPVLAGEARAVSAYRSILADKVKFDENLNAVRSADEQQEAPVAGDTSVSLELIISQSSAARGLDILRLQPAQSGGRVAFFDGADPGILMLWLADLEQRNGLSVVRLNVTKPTEDERLRGSVELARVGG